MMDLFLVVRMAHIIGACVLLGTGAGIAFFMVMAYRTRDPAIIAHTASIVVIADTLFTATAAIAQPVTGVYLAIMAGWSLAESWIVLSLLLYLVVGAFWVPVIFIQIRLRNIARKALSDGTPLPPTFDRLYRVWFAFGFPAFFAVLAILWLMLARPSIG